MVFTDLPESPTDSVVALLTSIRFLLKYRIWFVLYVKSSWLYCLATSHQSTVYSSKVIFLKLGSYRAVAITSRKHVTKHFRVARKYISVWPHHCCCPARAYPSNKKNRRAMKKKKTTGNEKNSRAMAINKGSELRHRR